MAECHPVGFQWVMEAKLRGATISHVDPRFTRTSAVADIHVPIRAGADIAFLGGIVNYIIQNERYFKDYVIHYTNAPAIVSKEFRTPKTWTACSVGGTRRRAGTTSSPGSTRGSRWLRPAKNGTCSPASPSRSGAPRSPPSVSTTRCRTLAASSRS